MAEKIKAKVKDKGLKPPEKQAKSTRIESDDSDIENEEEGGTVIGGVYIPPPPIAVCSGENHGPRLIITHIVNINFKSYAGRQVLGPFHKNFTSIIGPNGSGKSNVIDSMLFVFGYRATKIRSKKLSVLIHNSEQHRNIRSCTVEVHFVQIHDKGPGDFEEIPNSKIVISRSANVDNQSQYSINGKNARFKEVALLLRSHGIDLVHNRFLILQGEVEQIAMMKPKAQTEHETGMLEYLEDIIGTTRYKTPLVKLEGKLEDLNTEKAEKTARFKATEKELSSLNEPLKQAVEFLIKENDLIKLKNKMHQWHINEWNKKLKKATSEKASLESQHKEVEEKIKHVNETLAEKEKEISTKNKESESIRAKREHLKENLAKYDKQSTELKLDIGHSNQKRKKAMETKKQLEEKLTTMKNLPSKNNKEIEELKKVEEKLIKARNEEEAVVEKTLASLQRETEGLQENLNQLNNKLIGLNKIKDEANAKFEVAKTELDVYQNKEAKEKTKLEKLKATLVDVKNRLKEEQNKLSEASANLPGAQQQLSKSEAELAKIRHSEFEIRQKINDMMAKCQEKRHSLQDTRSRGRVLDYIMKQKEVSGIFGRLGDLGGIDAKYDCAISTACGFLDHIVTDTLETAGKCIDLLKKTGIGRASFIGLKEQEKLREQCNKPIKTPENIPRLFDLIKINDERLKPAFYFALRDTLVANDLEQAKRCAYGAVRHRVVTLSGEIIETSGTMSGGGREKRTGRMGRSASVITNGTSDDDLNLLDQQISEKRDQLQNVEHRRVTIETAISNLNSSIKKWKMNLSACEMQVKELQRQEHQLNQQIKNQESVVEAAAVNPDIVEEMTGKLNKLKKELDVAAKNSGEVEAEVKKVKSSIDAATGGRMKEVRQKLQKTITKLSKVTSEITKLGVGIRAAARDEVKTMNRITSLASEIAENESSILKAEELHHNLIAKVEKTNKEFEQINEAVTQLDKELKEMRSETSSLNKELSALKATKLNENQKLESVVKSIKESEQEINYRNKELQKLVLNEIPVFGGQEKQQERTESHNNELKKYTPEEIEEFDYNKLDYLSAQDSENLNTLRSKVNLNVVEVFREKNAELKTRLKDLESVTSVRNEIRKGYDEVRSARIKEFMAGFFIITNKLKEMYQMITLGGDAEFELVDNLDPFSEGVLFSVRPPKKSWKNISNLSGGEKTLSSLALVFALHYYKPSPLYVMDEIDAALDFKNVSIVATYIKERTKNAQFIIISLRSNMFELADLLVGIYKTHNCTKSVTVTPALYCTNSTNNNHEINSISENNIKQDTEEDLPPQPKKAKIN